MNYNGLELIKMTPENWDGRSREMLVWDNITKNALKKVVIGYQPYDKYWMTDEGYCWHYCAEIPTEEKEDVMKLMIDNENELLELKEENEELIAQIKSLCVERSKMANSVSSAVWKELMDRAENIDGPVNTMMAGFGFNDISDIVLNKILQYKEPIESISDESKKENKLRKMTFKELSEWLAKGNGQYKDGNFGSFRTELVYYQNEENTIVDDDCLIRGWNETEWHEPLIEE